MRNKKLICILLVLSIASMVLNIITITRVNELLQYHVHASQPKLEEIKDVNPQETYIPPTLTVTYTDLGVPTNVNTSFKTYMDYRTVTNTASKQYHYIKNWGWSDGEGFMRADGERDLGITDDYYLIALGSYYGTTIGTKYKITTSTGNVFYGVLADCKSDAHTNSTRQYASNRDVVEFIVDTRKLNKLVKRMGSANVYPPLNGTIAKIERIDFVEG